MARKRVRRYRRAKGRWSANIKQLIDQNIDTLADSDFFGTTDLCQNPIQNESSVSQQYTVKNVEISYEMDAHSTSMYYEGICVYIMYVPQGMNVDINYPSYHPEYIMAMKFLGSPNAEVTSNTPGRNPQKIKTRLARRLQTGDKIILYISGKNTTNSSGTIKFNGLIRWWTKAN